MSHPGCLHGPLQMFSPGNGVCNYLAPEKICGMLILQTDAFSPHELQGLSREPQDPPLGTPLA